ncbi:MAG: hypothetical protein JRH18_14395 [Deltaproteobacteria bacterium]|nr:hypothetical protein [Deltaproteobacteria bacterium]MBW1963043.1 hypothetical protein [Deltaproteobacteria bacterium]MBW1992960.1 hypothetical protein [Deltaproteobacteria bacterium]MBW2152846.1 hypothetical protein [Deltaproteobacteria bacterium]
MPAIKDVILVLIKLANPQRRKRRCQGEMGQDLKDRAQEEQAGEWEETGAARDKAKVVVLEPGPAAFVCARHAEKG